MNRRSSPHVQQIQASGGFYGAFAADLGLGREPHPGVVWMFIYGWLLQLCRRLELWPGKHTSWSGAEIQFFFARLLIIIYGAEDWNFGREAHCYSWLEDRGRGKRIVRLEPECSRRLE